MRFFFILWIVFSHAVIFSALPPIIRDTKQETSTSIAIPCCGKHFKHLNELLHHYAKQTQLPDEVVISLSDVECIPSDASDSLEAFSWPYRLKLIKNIGKRSAGENRNIAAMHCSNDVIIFQDADDLPHPQRIEIVKFLFDNYEVDHVMHLYNFPDLHIPLFVKEEIECVHDAFIESPLFTYTVDGVSCYITNGNICISKKLRKYKWKSDFTDGEDISFNRFIYDSPIRTAVLLVPLLIYRHSLSSFRPEE
jgi:glycosyltransferase involved in cell wall biosynthesis